jgi:hypothetical protein
MTTPTFPVSDIEEFAKYLGLDGTDADLFYECVYNLNEEYDDYESSWEGSTESIEIY